MKPIRADFFDFLNAGKITFQPYAVINGKRWSLKPVKKFFGQTGFTFTMNTKAA